MKLSYKYYLFDLDGTLTDSAPGIVNSVAFALDKFGIKVTDMEELKKFVGPPLVDAFEGFYGFSQDDALEAVKHYRSRYSTVGMFENSVYDGVKPVLETLRQNGKVLAIATSKPEKFTMTILDHFGLIEYFDFVAAATLDGTRGSKADVLRYALENLDIKDKTTALMVGDRDHDINGAKEVGIPVAGVLYGYGSFEELKNAGADYIINSPADVLEL